MKAMRIFFLILSSLYLQADQWNGSHYNTYSDQQFNGAVAHFSNEINWSFYNNAAVTILDLGCGSGRVTRYIANQLPLATIIGKDMSESMIAEAQQNNADLAPRVGFCVEPAQKLHQEETYDLIVCSAAIHWMDDHKTVFNNIIRALKPEGILLVIGAAQNKNHAIIQAFEETCSSEKWTYLNAADAYSQYNPMNLGQIEQQLKTAGIIVTKINSIEKNISFPTEEEFKNWFLGWAGGFKIMSQLTENEKNELQKDILTAFFNKAPRDSEGNIIYTITRGTIIAKKP